jgi:hypothetical protein
MMKKLLLVLALLAGVAVAAFAAPGAPAPVGKETVGEFALKVADALGLDPKDATAAVGALKQRGVTFAADLSATLTEGEAVRVLSDLGMTVVAPVNPGAAVSSVRATSMVAAIPPSANLERSLPSEDEGPTQCLTSADRGTCVNCCKDASGLTGKFCGRFCHANVPPPVSPGEPQP